MSEGVDDPMCSVVERPWTYKVYSFRYERAERGGLVELMLRRDTEVRRLTFDGVEDLEIQKGFPRATSGLAIYDIRARGLEDLGVRVSCFEPGPGGISFFAKSVREIEPLRGADR